MTSNVRVEVDGRSLQLSNLDKVLYPEVGFTKAQVIDYYARIAPVMLPHLADRCITLRRYPNGVEEASFFEKRCPSHRPDWLRTAVGPGDRTGAIHYCCLDEAASLVWTANLAAIELHSPMATSADLESPTILVFDLDPGLPATIVQCCEVALLLREVLDSVGLSGFAKTSGSKGLQVYVPLNAKHTHDHVSSFALAVGQLLMKQHPSLVLVNMAKSQRTGKVLVDWSQNSRHKTTVAPYSLRAKNRPTVSTPVMWDEVATGSQGVELSYEVADVLARVTKYGDLFAETLTLRQSLPMPAGG